MDTSTYLVALVTAWCALPLAAGASSIVVTTLDDAPGRGGDCTLRDAIRAANQDSPQGACAAEAGDDTIVFDTPSGVIHLVFDLPEITAPLRILGPGADVVAVDGGGTWRGFSFPSGPGAGHHEIRGLTIREMVAAEPGGAIRFARNGDLVVSDVFLRDNHAPNGGAISVSGDQVTLSRVAMISNTADNGGGALSWSSIGGSLSIEDSTFYDNHASLGGGALDLGGSGVFTIRRSTLTGNGAAGGGGAVFSLVAGASPNRIEHSTIVGNASDEEGDGSGVGGGIFVFASSTADIELFNTVVARNTRGDASGAGASADDLSDPSLRLLSLGHNLIGTNATVEGSFPAGLPNANDDLVGDAATPLDPAFAALADNGGPTRTHLPHAGSPAVDAGSCPGQSADQRGWVHPDGRTRAVDEVAAPDLDDGCDIGAVERAAVDPAIFSDGFESGGLDVWGS